jgi:signal transduction histidine kinase
MTLRWRLVAMAVVIPVLSLTLVGATQYYLLRVYLLYQTASAVHQMELTSVNARTPEIPLSIPPVVPGSLTAVYGIGPYGTPFPFVPRDAGWVRPPLATYPGLLTALPGDGSSQPGALGPGIPRSLYRVFVLLRLVPPGAYPSFMVTPGPFGDVMLTAYYITQWEVLLVETPLAPIDHELQAELVIFALASGVALVMIVALALWFTSRTLAPLRNVARVANEISGGAYDRRTGLRGTDEVATLATAFDKMVDRLETQIEQVSESEAGMRRFLTDASHELRTPVTGILGHLEVLRRGAADNREDLEQSLAAMYQTADRMARMVHDLLSLSRLDQGEMAVAGDKLDVGSLVEGAMREARPVTQHHVVRVELPEGPLAALGDRDAAERILVNLIDNAAKYSPRGSEIRVTARQDGDEAVEVLVSDRGVGIPVEDREQIFERFYRGDRSRFRLPKAGAGLGLAISRALARRQGGDLTVASSPGEGSTFVLRLPGGRRP